MRPREKRFSFVTFLFIIIDSTYTFHILNAYFYIEAHTHSNEDDEVEEKKASLLSGLFLCASPFPRVTRLNLAQKKERK